MDWFNSDPREKVNPPTIDQIQNIKAPTTIIIGEYDLSYFKDIAVILNNKIPNSSTVIIKNSGHISNLENIEQFNKTVEQQLG
jgi:pimeloyl-ACP methyl ester carboxylesterase